MQISEVKIVCKDGNTKVYINNESEQIRGVRKIEFKKSADRNDKPTLCLEIDIIPKL